MGTTTTLDSSGPCELQGVSEKHVMVFNAEQGLTTGIKGQAYIEGMLYH